MFTDNAKAVIALTTRLNDSGRRALSPTRWHALDGALAEAGLEPADVFERGDEIAALPGLKPAVAEAIPDLLRDAAATTVAASDLSERGIWTVTIVDDDYPDTFTGRLDKNAPPVIFGVGDRGLLTGIGVGIVGSRNVTEPGAAAATAVARAAARLARPVVSGGAKGVDQLAMNAAFKAEGAVIGVVADSLQSRVTKPETLGALDSGSVCLLTQQAPSAGFSVGSAMSRNKLIYALSAATVVVASDEGSGGTWTGAVEALKNKNGKVLVWRGEGEGPGNATLEKQGAVPITSAEQLEDLLRPDEEPESKPDAEQLSLTEIGP